MNPAAMQVSRENGNAPCSTKWSGDVVLKFLDIFQNYEVL
jgi:hypothetical protein